MSAVTTPNVAPVEEGDKFILRDAQGSDYNKGMKYATKVEAQAAADEWNEYYKSF